MASLPNLYRYIVTKIDYTVSLTHKTYAQGRLTEAQALNVMLRTFFAGRLTFLHRSKGEEMAPTIGTEGGTLLVRKIPEADTTKLNIGDMVMLKDPIKSDKYLVRRLAATEGYEMASADEKDESFVLEENECWVLADNEEVKPKDSYDSRTFGPVSMTNIIGRVIYCLRNEVDHGPVANSKDSVREDSPVLAMELDVDELKEKHDQ